MTVPSEHEISSVLNRLRRETYLPVADLAVTCWRTKEPVPFSERESGEKRVLTPDD